MPNIEIKARYRDLDQARVIAQKHQTEYLGVLRQIDTYFVTRAGRLKLREINGETAQLIPYIKDYRMGPMRSDYALLPVENPAQLKGLLSALLGVEFVVDKTREVFLIENVRVHLDQVVGLGTFLEFEAVYTHDSEEERLRQTQKLDELMRVFEVQTQDLMELSYLDYLSTSSCRSSLLNGEFPSVELIK